MDVADGCLAMILDADEYQRPNPVHWSACLPLCCQERRRFGFVRAATRHPEAGKRVSAAVCWSLGIHPTSATFIVDSLHVLTSSLVTFDPASPMVGMLLAETSPRLPACFLLPILVSRCLGQFAARTILLLYPEYGLIN